MTMRGLQKGGDTEKKINLYDTQFALEPHMRMSSIPRQLNWNDWQATGCLTEYDTIILFYSINDHKSRWNRAGTYVAKILCIVFNVGIVKISAAFVLYRTNERMKTKNITRYYRRRYLRYTGRPTTNNIIIESKQNIF